MYVFIRNVSISATLVCWVEVITLHLLRTPMDDGITSMTAHVK